MKPLFEFTGSGSVTTGGFNKPLGGIIKRTISITPQSEKSQSGCPCKNLPGKVTCGLCNPRKK